MTEKPKKTPKEELEYPEKYVYDTGIIFECKENIRVEIIGEDVVDLLNELTTKCSKLEKENEQLKNEVYDWKASAEDYLKLGQSLKKENEQLKQSNQEAIEHILDGIVEMHDGKRDYAETIFNKAIKLLNGDVE